MNFDDYPALMALPEWRELPDDTARMMWVMDFIRQHGVRVAREYQPSDDLPPEVFAREIDATIAALIQMYDIGIARGLWPAQTDEEICDMLNIPHDRRPELLERLRKDVTSGSFGVRATHLWEQSAGCV